MKNYRELDVYLHLITTGGGDLTSYILQFYYSKNYLCVSDVKTNSVLDHPLKRRLARRQNMLARYQARYHWINFIYGHTPFIQNHDSIYARKVKYFTMLRDPVKRFVSQYRRIINDNNTLPSFKRWLNANTDQFVSFNHQTDFVSGCEQLFSNQDDLEIAKKNLEVFKFVGITDFFNDSLKLFCKIYDLPYAQAKPASKFKSKIVIPVNEEILKYIEEKSYLDRQLYDHAERRFRKDIKAYASVKLYQPSLLDKFISFPIKKADRFSSVVIWRLYGKMTGEIVSY